MDYRPTGVCSQLIHVELDGTTIKNVEFLGGCNGNTKGLSSLVRGMDANEALEKAKGQYGRVDDAVKFINPRNE